LKNYIAGSEWTKQKATLEGIKQLLLECAILESHWFRKHWIIG